MTCTSPSRLDPVGGALSALSLSALVWAFIEGPQRGWGDSLVVGGFVGTVVLGVAFVAWELRRSEPMLDPRLFKLRGFTSGSLSIFVQFFATFGLIFVLLQFLQLVLGYTPLEAGAALAPDRAHDHRGGAARPAARRASRRASRRTDRPGADGDRALRALVDGRRLVVLAPARGWPRARPGHGAGCDSRHDGDRRVAAGREAGRRLGGQRRVARGRRRARHRGARQRPGRPRRPARAGHGFGGLRRRVQRRADRRRRGPDRRCAGRRPAGAAPRAGVPAPHPRPCSPSDPGGRAR